MVRSSWPRVHEHVGRLDIPVHQPGGMGRIESRGHRGDDRGRSGTWQGALPADERADITAGHIPHRDEQHPVRLTGFEHRDNVRIIHCRR